MGGGAYWVALGGFEYSSTLETTKSCSSKESGTSPVAPEMPK